MPPMSLEVQDHASHHHSDVSICEYESDNDARVGGVEKGSNDSGLGMSFFIRLFILFTNNIYGY